MTLAVVLSLRILVGVASAVPPVYDHVVVVFEENKDYTEVIGSPSAPYINQLAQGGVSFTSMFAETHPSQANYFWAFSGANQGVTGDNQPPNTPFTTPNLGAALRAAGKSFTGYSEDLPAPGSTIFEQDLYARRHNPWIAWQDDSPTPGPNTLPASTNLPFTAFPSNYSELPTLAMVTPNLINDMHDGQSADAIPLGDTWLQNNISGYAEWAKTHNSLLVVVWDESELFSSQNRIPMVLYGANLNNGQQVPTMYNHVNLLRTFEDMYGLSHSGAAATAAPIVGPFAGEVIPPQTNFTKTFQEAAAGYQGTLDTELRQVEPDAVLGEATKTTVALDGSTAPGVQTNQGLIRFTKLVGDGADQIAKGTQITSAHLLITTGNDFRNDFSNDTFELHQMLAPWDEQSTWNTLADGVSLDDIEASSAMDASAQATFFSRTVSFDVTEAVQKWINGERNYGWLIVSQGSDPWGWQSSEAGNASTHPILEINYSVVPEPSAEVLIALGAVSISLVRIRSAARRLPASVLARGIQ